MLRGESSVRRCARWLLLVVTIGWARGSVLAQGATFTGLGDLKRHTALPAGDFLETERGARKSSSSGRGSASF